MEDKIQQKVWLTKYALSKGIEEVLETKYSDRFWMLDGYRGLYSMADFAWDWNEAVKQATVARDQKIDSLRKQIAKLEKLNFRKEPA